MSFSRLGYDECTYQHTLKESAGPGHYMLQRPPVGCGKAGACFAPSPSVRMGLGGVGVATCANLVDVDSELLGLNRRASRCPTDKYLPSDKPFCQATMPAASDACREMDAENSRLTNPPCTLRGTGWNRWEWLCQDPQDRALVPFQFNVNNRLVVKDNHRPCVPRPLDPARALPSDELTKPHCNQGRWDKQAPITQLPVPHVSDQVPSIHWRSC